MTEQLDLFGQRADMRELARQTMERLAREEREGREQAHRWCLERSVRDYGLVVCPECAGDDAQARWRPSPCPRCGGHFWLWPDGTMLSYSQFWGVLSLEEPDVVRALPGVE